MKRIGTELELTDDDRQKLLTALNYWHRQLLDDRLLVHRREYEKALLCIWEGQVAQGVRVDGKEQAWPFEGASDQRLRWADAIYQKLLSLALISISSCEVELTCGGTPEEQERAAALKLLLNSVMDQMGARGYAKIMEMLRYMLCDSPAVAALEVQWKKRVTKGVMVLDREDLETEYAATMANAGIMAETDAAAQFALVVTGQSENEADYLAVEQWLVATKGVAQKDVQAVVEALGEDGECECLTTVDTQEGPELDALRYGDDFCVPVITDDFDYASPWFRGEWCTESQLRERIIDQCWSREWVEETLEHRAQEMFREEGTVCYEDVKDLVNIVWCYTAETDDNGVTTRYVSVISLAEGSAFGKRVIRSRRGKWNTVFFRREVIDGNILAGRGIAELVAPAQGIAKAVRDMAANNAIVGSLPPIKAKGARTRNSVIEPFSVINMGASDDVTFMQPPAYPAAAKETEEKIKAEVLDYIGISDGQTDVTERRRQFTDWILKQWRDFLIQLLEVVQDNASDEYIVRATTTKDAKGVKAAEVAGAFSITLRLDPTNLDNTKLIEKVQAASQVLQSMDRKGTVDTDPFVRHFFGMLFPEMRTAALKTPDELTQDDIKDEQNNFVLIKSGIMPQMETTGKWNYAARLQWWQQLQQTNPNALMDMSGPSQEMAQQWMAALEQQNTQFGENAEIGKTGVQGVTAQ